MFCGADPAVPGTMSSTRVPPLVPSDTANSSPDTQSFAAKYSFPRSATGSILAPEPATIGAQKILDALLESSKTRRVDPYFIALIHLPLGESDRTFEWLEKAMEKRSIMLLWFGVEPRLDRIRGDARQAAILRRLGFSRS